MQHYKEIHENDTVLMCNGMRSDYVHQSKENPFSFIKTTTDCRHTIHAPFHNFFWIFVRTFECVHSTGVFHEFVINKSIFTVNKRNCYNKCVIFGVVNLNKLINKWSGQRPRNLTLFKLFSFSNSPVWVLKTFGVEMRVIQKSLVVFID